MECALVAACVASTDDQPGPRWSTSLGPVAVANFTVASTPRTFDRQSGEWKDGDALFLRCTAWRDPAEHIAESLTRGDRVVVQGRLRQRSFETRDGDKRTVVELDVDDIGPSLRYATVKVTKAHRAGADSPGTGPDEPPF